jgi:hypothetical protein
MMMGMSTRSFAISASRVFNAVRSGEPGAKFLTGSLTGTGTRLVPVNPAIGVGMVIRHLGEHCTFV